MSKITHSESISSACSVNTVREYIESIAVIVEDGVLKLLGNDCGCNELSSESIVLPVLCVLHESELLRPFLVSLLNTRRC